MLKTVLQYKGGAIAAGIMHALAAIACGGTALHAQTQTIILGRPTDTSVTASVLFDQSVRFYLEYSAKPGVYSNRTDTVLTAANVPDEKDITGLKPDTRYYYRLRYKPAASGTFTSSPEYSFHTQRAPGKTFRFLIEADEHLYDKKGVRSIYQITLDNQARDSADFLLSLGDIFGDDHTPDQTTSADMDALHKDYLQYLGKVCHSMPFYVCLGNHEGETGYYLKQNAPNNIAVYGTLWRKYYYPNPYPNGFYTGNTTQEPYGIGQPENYYAWQWGDALFVALDVYRDCDVNDKPQNWDWTLGQTQYMWLKNALESSKAKYKFVFAHHNRGQGRGAVAVARGYEWGGYNKDKYEFDTYRPGWGLPIHQLMVKNGVNVFFQGHDHLFAKEALDGLVYQEVPMPSDSTYQIGVLANADAYTDVTMDGTGHIRVTVAPDSVTVDYIRAYLPADTVGGLHRNREVAYSYTVRKGASWVSSPPVPVLTEKTFTATHVPAQSVVLVRCNNAAEYDRKVELIDMQGQMVRERVLERGHTTCLVEAGTLPAGIYAVRMPDEHRTGVAAMVAVVR